MFTNSVSIKIVNQSVNDLPAYATLGSSGMDIRASIAEPMVLQPAERVLVPTGLFVEIPLGYEIQIRPRSGLAIKQGITCLNTPGTIDADYRGEVCVILINLGKEPFSYKHGDRIAQMGVYRVEMCPAVEVQVLEDTARGAGGFGHTGV